ncbi:hypothetical protein FCV25MIE_08139 [Fagus crenata]
MDAINPTHKRESSKNLKVHFEVPPNEVDPETHSQISGSLTLSGSSQDLDAIDKVFNSHSLETKQAGLQTQGPTSSADQLSPSPMWSFQSGSAPQFPPIQLMGKPAGYDPNRIPSSIFSTKPTTPLEWSTASNESLFSIHIGNTSFSKDHFIAFNKSQELLRPDELLNIPASFPRFTELEHDKSKSANVGKDTGVTKASDETTKVVRRETSGDHNKERVPPSTGVQSYFSVSYHSDVNNISTRSFHFPM